MTKIDDKKVYPYALGTAWINSVKVPGTPPRFLPAKGNEAANIDILRRCIYQILDRGHGRAIIDLAQIYGDGYTDCVVGEALKLFPRDKLFLIWKVHCHTLTSELSVWSALSRALSKLRVEYVDVLMSHETPTDDLSYLANLEYMAAYDLGLTKSIGLGRVGIEQLEKACKLSRIACIQNSGSLAERRFLPDYFVQFCKQKEIPILAYRPVRMIFEDHALLNRLAVVYELLEQRWTYAQIAIAWSCTKGFIPIGSSTDPRHMQQNIEAVSLRLNDNQMAILEGRK